MPGRTAIGPLPYYKTPRSVETEQAASTGKEYPLPDEAVSARADARFAHFYVSAIPYCPVVPFYGQNAARRVPTVRSNQQQAKPMPFVRVFYPHPGEHLISQKETEVTENRDFYRQPRERAMGVPQRWTDP
jgi:hypothetical protein